MSPLTAAAAAASGTASEARSEDLRRGDWGSLSSAPGAPWASPPQLLGWARQVATKDYCLLSGEGMLPTAPDSQQHLPLLPGQVRSGLPRAVGKRGDACASSSPLAWGASLPGGGVIPEPSAFFNHFPSPPQVTSACGSGLEGGGCGPPPPHSLSDTEEAVGGIALSSGL